MKPEDLDRIEEAAQRQSSRQLASAITVMPGEALELCRLARIGQAVEAQAKAQRGLHQDDGA